MFENLSTCPLTGLSLAGGQAKFSPYHGNNQQVLYSFAPIGSAVFDFHSFIMLNKSIIDGNRKPNLALAGICREASELGKGPLLVTTQMINGPQEGTPTTFEEKQARFMHLLYQTGSKEHKKRDIYINNDFPLAFAEDAEEFTRILESLIDEELIRYDRPNDTPNDWPYGIRTEYDGVLLTTAGKQLIDRPSKVATRNEVSTEPALTSLHPTVKQVATHLFDNGHYRQAVLDVYIMLDKAVQHKAQQPANLTGKLLMDTVFSAKNPILKLSNDSNEQLGFMQLFSGAVQAIRNHYAHNLSELESQQALEWLYYASALFRKVDEAELVQRSVDA